MVKKKEELKPLDIEIVTKEDLEDIQDDDVEELEELFNNNSETSVLKELFNDKRFKTKTDVNDDEISIMSRLYFMSEITNRPKLKRVLDEFLILRISKDRQSRKEFVEAQKERNTENKAGFLQNLLGRNQM